MLLQIISNSSITAKVHVMRKGRLKERDYQDLMEAKSVPDLASYLQVHTYYSGVLDSDCREIHRGKLEELLNLAFKRDYEKLLKFASGPVKRFLKLYIIRNEIEDLKNKIRKSNSFEDLIEYTKGTKYYDILSPFIKNKSHRDIFNMEMALDMYYFKFAWRLSNRVLSGIDRKIVQKTLSLDIDLLNISFILRARERYNLMPNMIYPYIIPHYKRFSRDSIKSMVESKSTEELMSIASEITRGVVGNSADFFEKDIRQVIFRLHSKMFARNPYTISAPLSYLHFKEVEIRNIIVMAEGIRYSANKEEIEEHVIKV